MIRVLHVEDSDTDHELVRLALDEAAPGWSDRVDLARARSFDEGAKAARAADIVVLDLNLPGRRGEGLLQLLKSDKATRRLPVVVLSSSECPHDMARCYEAHAAAYVVKPATFQGLVELMGALEAFWLRHVALVY